MDFILTKGFIHQPAHVGPVIRDVTLAYTNDGGTLWSRHAITAPFSAGRIGPMGTQTGPQALWTISHGHVSLEKSTSGEGGDPTTRT